MSITRVSALRILPALLVGTGLLSLAGCAVVATTTVQGQLSSNPQLPTLDVRRVSLRAALVVPASVQATISKLLICAPSNAYTLQFPVGELVSRVAEEMLSQVFVSVNRTDDKAAARGNYDVVVELTSPVVRMENNCMGNAPRDLIVRSVLGGIITERGGKKLGATSSVEKEQLALASSSNGYQAEVVMPALEQALIKATAVLVGRLGRDPKLIEYARAFKAPREAPSSRGPVAPSPLITAPPIY